MKFSFFFLFSMNIEFFFSSFSIFESFKQYAATITYNAYYNILGMYTKIISNFNRKKFSGRQDITGVLEENILN